MFVSCVFVGFLEAPPISKVVIFTRVKGLGGV